MQVFVLLALIATCGALSDGAGQNCNEMSRVSTLRPTWERVFLRKRRYVLFPTGGTLKFTVFLSKGFLALYPRGLTFLIEAAFYYPGPARRIDLIPKPLRPPTTAAPKPLGSTQPNYVYIPGSLIRYKAKPVAKPVKVQRIDENITIAMPTYANRYEQKYSQPSKWQKYDRYEQKYNMTKAQAGWPQWQKYDRYEQKYGTTKAQSGWPQWQKYDRYEQKYDTTKAQSGWHRWTTPMPERTSWSRWSRESDSAHPEFMEPTGKEWPDLDEFTHSEHYHGHRDRRQLFHNFEGFSKLVGFDMKLCILRAMCDAKQMLLPKGYSLIHDILRVIFSFPTISGLDDDYSRIMKADYQQCSQKLKGSCPINLLHWFKNFSTQ